MNNQETLIQLESMKMKGMAQAFSAIMNLAPHNRPPLEQIMAKMVESEILFRNGVPVPDNHCCDVLAKDRIPDRKGHRIRNTAI